jgi:hypothetical protein
MTTRQFLESQIDELCDSPAGDADARSDEWSRLVFLLSTNEYPKVWSSLKNTTSRANLIYAWAQKDPSTALDALLTLPENTDRDSLMESVLRCWAAADPGGVVTWLHRVPEGERRDNLLRRTIGGMAGQHPAAAAKLLDEIPPGAFRDNAVVSFVEECSPIHPEAAAALAETAHAVFQRQGLYHDVGMGWAERNGLEALAWAQSLSNTADRRDALAGVVRTMVQSQPEAACRIVLAEADSITRDQLIGSLARGWAESDLPAAANWVNELPEPSFREKAWEGLSRSWVAQDPEGAASFALFSLPAGQARNAALETIGREWTQSGWDERAARRWADRVASGPERDAFLAGLASPSWRVER